MLNRAWVIREITEEMCVRPGLRHLMTVLLLFADSKQPVAKVSKKQVARVMGVSERHVARGLAELVELGYIGPGDKSGHRKILVSHARRKRVGPTITDAMAVLAKQDRVDPRYTGSGIPAPGSVPETDHAD